MATFKGGEAVKGGYYLNLGGWTLHAVDGRRGTLPGDGARYVRLPLLALLGLAPVLGLAFVILLPFIGLGVVAEQLWKTVTTTRAARRTTIITAATTHRR